MVIINGTGIRVTRGDSVRFTIHLTGRDLPDGTLTLFTVKKRAWRHEQPDIELEIPVMGNDVDVILAPDVTDIEASEYVWDLRVLEDAAEGAEVLTPMEYASFEVMEAIGDE